MTSHKPPAHVETLARQLGCEWRALSNASRRTSERRADLSKLLEGENSADAKVVVYGSMAREEMTSESDLDWTLLPRQGS